MTGLTATAYFRQAAWSDDENLSDKTKQAVDQAEGDWHTHRQYLAEDHMNKHLVDEESNRLAHMGHAQRTADKVTDAEGMPRIKVVDHPSDNVAGRGTAHDGTPVIALGYNTMKHTTLLHELTHHKRQPADDDPDHNAGGFMGDYIGMLQRHHPDPKAWEHFMTANRLAGNYMRNNPEKFPERTTTATAFFRTAAAKDGDDVPSGLLNPHGHHVKVDTEYQDNVELVPRHEVLRYASQETDPEHAKEVGTQIAQNGRMTPLILHYHPKTSEAYLGEGNHRLRAARTLQMDHVPVRVTRWNSELPGPGVKTPQEHPAIAAGTHVPGDIKPSDLGFSTLDTQGHGGGMSATSFFRQAAEEPSPKVWKWKGQAYGPDGGYIDKEYEVHGPLYHGGGKRLREGDQVKPGRKTNPWGDEGAKSSHVYFTTRKDTAAAYAQQSGGHVYEVEPTGDFRMDYNGDDYKTHHPLNVVRKLHPDEWRDEAPKAPDTTTSFFRQAAAEGYSEDSAKTQEGSHVRDAERTAGKGKPRHQPGAGDGAAGEGEDAAGAAPDGGGSEEESRAVTWHPAASKEMSKLAAPDQKQISATVDSLAANGHGPQTHTLNGRLKGWSATKASRGHRIVHRDMDDGTLHIGYVGLHDYDRAIKRLTSLQASATAFFRQTASVDDNDSTETIRMVAPEEYRKFHFPDYPQAKTLPSLVRHFKKTAPDYYAKVRDDVQKNGFTTPILVQYKDQRGNPLKKPHVMEGHHRAAVAHELGLHLPVGDYDNQADVQRSLKGNGQWFQNNERPPQGMSWHTGAAQEVTASDPGAAILKQAAAETGTGIMVALVPPREIAEQMAREGGEPAERLHVTMAYLGKTADYTKEQLAWLPELVGSWAARQKPVSARVGGAGKFENGDEHVLWAAVDIPGGAQMHSSLAAFLTGHGYRLPSEHGWQAHLTLAYVGKHFRFMPRLGDHRWTSAEVWTVIGGKWSKATLGAGPR